MLIYIYIILFKTAIFLFFQKFLVLFIYFSSFYPSRFKNFFIVKPYQKKKEFTTKKEKKNNYYIFCLIRHSIVIKYYNLKQTNRLCNAALLTDILLHDIS